MKLVVATRNRHKVREIAVLLAEAGLDIEAVTIDDVKRVSKRLFNPARLTIVVAGTMVDPKAVKH